MVGLDPEGEKAAGLMTRWRLEWSDHEGYCPQKCPLVTTYDHLGVGGAATEVFVISRVYDFLGVMF